MIYVICHLFHLLLDDDNSCFQLAEVASSLLGPAFWFGSQDLSFHTGGANRLGVFAIKYTVHVSNALLVLCNKMANIVEAVKGKVQKQATVEFAATAVANEIRGFFPSSFLNLRCFATKASMVALVILF